MLQVPEFGQPGEDYSSLCQPIKRRTGISRENSFEELQKMIEKKESCEEKCSGALLTGPTLEPPSIDVKTRTFNTQVLHRWIWSTQEEA